MRCCAQYGAWTRRGKAALVAAAMFLAPALAAQPVSVVALGDSLTQGYGLVAGEGFVPQLQAWLEKQGAEATVINAGVSGDTTAGGLARVAWALTPDTDAMIVTLGGNDVLRGLPPEMSRANIEGILQVAQKAGVAVLLVGMQAPGNYGPGYKAAFDAIYPELAAQYGVDFAESFFKGLPGDDPAVVREFFQPDGIHPNAAGVARIVEGLGPDVLRLIDRVGG